MRNPFKSAISRGDKVIGLWLSMANPYTAEMCATAGFQWLLIDGERVEAAAEVEFTLATCEVDLLATEADAD